MSILGKIAENVICGKADKNSRGILNPATQNTPFGIRQSEFETEPGVKELVEEALARGVPVRVILEEGLIAGMDIVGERFRKNELWVPQVMLAAKAMKAGLEVIRPYLVAHNIQPIGDFIIGTVRGDQHDIGKNLVAMMMEGAGFRVIDLGVNVAPEKFATEAEKFSGKNIILGMSALLTLTLPAMAETIRLFAERGIREHAKIMVGGAPVTEEYAKMIGADAYAADAADAVIKAKQLLGLYESV